MRHWKTIYSNKQQKNMELKSTCSPMGGSRIPQQMQLSLKSTNWRASVVPVDKVTAPIAYKKVVAGK